MKNSWVFLRLSAFTTLVRLIYQIGKGPVLLALALSLSVSDAFLGLVIGLSSVTGILAKPIIGYWGDRFDKSILIYVCVCFLAFPFFLYPFVENAIVLTGVRLIHGVTTAVLGPVTFSLVSQLSVFTSPAERFAWFSLDRQIASFFAPLLGAALLIFLNVNVIFSLLGLSAALLLPFLVWIIPQLRTIDKKGCPTKNKKFVSVTLKDFSLSTLKIIQLPAVLLAVSLDFCIFFTTYFFKLFIPVLILKSGASFLEIGLIMSIQEVSNAVLKPILGRACTWLGIPFALVCGCVLLTATTLLLPLMISAGILLLAAAIFGAIQGLVQAISPALLVNTKSEIRTQAFGIAGAARNLAKVCGPALGGLLIFWFGLNVTVLIIGSTPLLLVFFARRSRSFPAQQNISSNGVVGSTE